MRRLKKIAIEVTPGKPGPGRVSVDATISMEYGDPVEPTDFLLSKHFDFDEDHFVSMYDKYMATISEELFKRMFLDTPHKG